MGERRRPLSARAVARWKEPPRYLPSDVLALLWRQWPLMIVVFVVILAIGVIVALKMHTTYPARSSILIRLGQEYVYQPAFGDAARGTTLDNDQVVQSELAILGSEAVKAQVVQDIGVARLSPELGRAYAKASPDKRKDIESAAIRAIEMGLKINSAPGNSIVSLSYTSRDPQLSALVLNTLVDEYLRYRRAVLIDKDAGPIQQQLDALQGRLAKADQDYQAFLTQNGVESGDYDAEKASLSQIYGQLTTENYSVQAALSEAQGRLGATAGEVASTQPEIGLYRDLDHSAQDKLAALRTSRADLLSRYLPGTQPIRDIDQQIIAQEALIRSGLNATEGAKRVGPNPTYQSLVTEKNTLQAQVASLRDRKAQIAASLAEIAGRRMKLSALDPQYQDLSRQRDLLTANVKSLAQRAQESQATEALAKNGEGNIRVIERAYPPTTGVSLKKPVMLLSVVFAAFAALCAGLLAAFLSKGYPTPEAVERELELPVLIATPRMA